MARTPWMIVSCSLMATALMLFPSFTTAADSSAPGRMLYQSVAQYGDQFDLISWSVGYESNDRFDFGFRGGAMVLVYTANVTSSSRLDDWQLFAELSAVVEFQDNDNGYYDAGDSVISDTNLEGTTWNTTYTEQEHWLDELNLSRNSILTVCSAANLSAEFFASDNGTEVYGYDIRSTEIMANLTIGPCNWSDEADYIAVKIDMQAGPHTFVDPDVTYNEIANRTASHYPSSVDVFYDRGSFRWGAAKVDGSFESINSTWSWDGLYLSAPKGEYISYLLFFTVESLAEDSGPYIEEPEVEGSLPYFAIGTVVAAAIVTAAILLATRTGRRLKA